MAGVVLISQVRDTFNGRNLVCKKWANEQRPCYL